MESASILQHSCIIDSDVNVTSYLNDLSGGMVSHECNNRVWLYNQNCVLLVEATTGKCIHRWKCSYGKIKKVCEMVVGAGCYLTVLSTLNSEANGDVVILLNTSSLSIVKSIYVAENISSLSIVQHSPLAHSLLNTFAGIVAIGCYGGRIFLVNLNLNQYDERPVHQPLPIKILNKSEHFEVQNGEHIALEISKGKHTVNCICVFCSRKFFSYIYWCNELYIIAVYCGVNL